MRIKKTSETRALAGSILNTQNSSTTDTYSCDYVNKLNTYSTTEQKVGTWINNKPIYRKVYTNIAVNQSIHLDISDLSADEIIDIKYTHYDGITTFDFNNRYGVWTGNEQFCRIYRQTNSLNDLILETAFTGSIFKYIILEYTKTTD